MTANATFTYTALTLTLPWPETQLWPNRSNGKHWTSKADVIARARQAAKVATLECLDGDEFPPFSQAKLTITFHSPNPVRYDLQNAFSALKGQIDGIADALQTNDHNFGPVVLQRGVYGKPGSVEIQIEVTQ
jgi:crossover junction endodeoxyribonuclease RusA